MGDLLRLIKFSHTLFALPFALMAMLVAAQGLPSVRILALILLCMVGARTAAMAFNRWTDWKWDIQNPRTQGRSQLATKNAALGLCLAGLALLVFGAWKLNPLCFLLSPVAIALTLGYSLTKRFTSFSHAFLGLALSAAPMGAWAAVRGTLFDLEPWILAAAVMLWVFGFDLIYATQDEAFDRRVGLHSFPARYGADAARRLALGLHVAAWFLFGLFGWRADLSWGYAVAIVLSALALAYEHRLSATEDAVILNRAFFHMNALVSLGLLGGAAADLWIAF